MSAGFKKDAGWAKWEKALDPRIFSKRLTKNIRRATALNAKLGERTVRKTIRAGGFEPNKPLTVMIKGSRKPLVDHGGLFQAITSVVVDDVTAFVGVIKTHGFHNIALALHEGQTIQVTPKMRGLFFYLWQASIGQLDPESLEGRARELWERRPGGDWRPLKTSTTHIVIPARPFIKVAFFDDQMRAQAIQNWEQAIQKTMKDLAGG